MEILPCVQVLAGGEWFVRERCSALTWPWPWPFFPRWEPRIVGFSEGLALALALVMGASVFELVDTGLRRRSLEVIVS